MSSRKNSLDYRVFRHVLSKVDVRYIEGRTSVKGKVDAGEGWMQRRERIEVEM